MRKTLSDRISSKIRFAHDLSPNGTPGCIVWTGGLNAPGGYGHVRVGKTMKLAHNAALMLAGIKTPQGHEQDHLCRRRTCINVRHLEAVTGAENVRRGACAKLTAQDVAEIRFLHAVGAVRNEIAATYGITRQQVHHIVTRKRWAV